MQRSGKTVVRRRINEISDERLMAIGFTQAVASFVVAGVFLAWLPAPVLAQSTGAAEAGEIMCDSGLGQLVSLALGAFVVFLLLLGSFRMLNAVKDMGSPRPDKKKQGREELTGSLVTLGGVFALPALALALERVGLTTLSCVQMDQII